MQEAYLDRVDLKALTDKTVTGRGQLMQIFQRVATEGYAILDEELEIGVRSVAVPVKGKAGVVAALNVGMSTARVSLEDLRKRILPALRETAADLSL